jgi:hypothetical protein
VAAPTVEDVKNWGDLDTGGVVVPAILDRVFAATIVFLQSRYALLPADLEDWEEDANLGLIMQAARLYKRRRSPEGVAGFAEFGVVRVSRVDPDVAELLKPYYVPRVGAAGGTTVTSIGSYVGGYLVRQVTQAEYDALTPDPTRDIYVIVG